MSKIVIKAIRDALEEAGIKITTDDEGLATISYEDEVVYEGGIKEIFLEEFEAVPPKREIVFEVMDGDILIRKGLTAPYYFFDCVSDNHNKLFLSTTDELKVKLFRTDAKIYVKVFLGIYDQHKDGVPYTEVFSGYVTEDKEVTHKLVKGERYYLAVVVNQER